MASAADTLRRFLYGDVPLAEWSGTDDGSGEPWPSFARARDALWAGQTEQAIGIWEGIARTSGYESRQTLQAWSFLRRQGVLPRDEESVRVLGVICEVPIGGAHDVLAAYRDGSSRYLNHAGGAVVADCGPSVPLAIQVVATADPLGSAIGLWDEPALPPLPTGDARLLLLTPGGFRFGQGPQEALWQEPLAGPVLNAATQLLVQLTSST